MAVWIIGPRHVSGWSSGTKNPIEISFTPWLYAGTSLPSCCSGGRSTPIIIGTLGPYTSASRSPTFAPCRTRPTARLTATVVLPTPPLPLLTAMAFLTVGMRLSLSCERPCCTVAVKSTSTFVTPGIAPTALSQLALISVLSGQAGVVSTTVNLTAPPSIFRSLTMLRVMRSLCSSGSITVRSASMTACSVTAAISYPSLGDYFSTASAQSYAELPGTRAVLFLHARSVISLLERRISSGLDPKEAQDVIRDCWQSRDQGFLRMKDTANL